ncbi:MAG: hypothetical protein GWN14_06480 [candidate division Zixibacteria bacterium]|nr:hypothetical protein [candidate division Zixibacteria bacterium]
MKICEVNMLENINPLFKAQINHWRKAIKPGIIEALEAVPDEKLDWAPSQGMIPLGMIFLHMAETSDWWYDDIMKGQPATELAFLDKECPPKDKIAEHLEEHWNRLERFFSEDEEALKNIYERESESWKISKTGYWIFMHLFEHDIHHRSQIHHYLRILGIKPPKI